MLSVQTGLKASNKLLLTGSAVQCVNKTTSKDLNSAISDIRHLFVSKSKMNIERTVLLRKVFTVARIKSTESFANIYSMT